MKKTKGIPPKLNSRLKRTTPLLGVILFLVAVVGGIYFYLYRQAKMPITNAKIYTSKALGLRFSYLYKPNGESKDGILVKEIGSRIYVYYEGSKPEDGQYVELFAKEKADNIETAIKTLFLKGYEPSACPITVSKDPNNYPHSYTVAVMNYKNPPYEPNFNSDLCPTPFTQWGGKAFFLADDNHPNKLLFFSIGQWGALAGKNKTWQDTVEFIN